MENLLVLLDKIHQVSPLPVFSKEIIVVQNAGMQHWLNMSLAQSRQISLANEFLLPAQFLWQLMRSLANAEKVPEQSPYSREALCWRIYQELAHDDVVENEIYQQVTRYWSKADNANMKEQQLKRYQLSCQLADLYEQYLVFRPEWINNWYNDNNLSDNDTSVEALSAWQSDLWLRLTRTMPYDPIELMQSAIDNIADNLHLLPQRISFFGINAMAPMWLSFINAISEHTQVHFFHLNPCFNYWGDIKTQKQALQHMTEWTAGYDDLSNLVGNPILANLGQQGREFLALLQQFSTIDIDVYQSFLAEKNSDSSTHSVLSLIQEDILTLKDGCQHPQQIVDNSIVVTSAHSALREVQGLHDWLLHQFNEDPSLTPKDILVMCPQVEEYAPYVQAVFAKGWEDLAGDIPPLPCSISDRVSKESDPLVIAFTEIISLPDSRFCVSQIISWLRIPTIQSKFGFTPEDIEKCSHWLQEACVHWGLNQTHKQKVLNSHNISGQFTWQFGFSKLLQGFAYADTNSLYQEQVLLANVEGNDAIILGNLMLFIEQLQLFSTTLSNAKTPQQWHQFLQDLLVQFFDLADEGGFLAINHAIESLVEYCEHAQFNQLLELNIIKEFLNNHFSQPDAGRQFMVGQVTFCSMLPMRSIPFKIIAVLGLNDGEFPRQRQPLGFDLMSLHPSKVGDRSRRGDDKYLFLEAIISARQALYLSFQGRNIKRNTAKEPSVVLKELMNYLSLAYGWQFDVDTNKQNDKNQDSESNQLRQLPMQAFSLRNFHGMYPSFDPHWLSLGNALLKESDKNDSIDENTVNKNKQSTLFLPLLNDIFNDIKNDIENEINITEADLVSFYHHPAKYFAKKRLALFLDNDTVELSDIEPFTPNRLESYLFNQEVLSHHLSDEPEPLETNLAGTIAFAKGSGKFPELPTMDDYYQKWLADSELLALAITNDNTTEEPIERVTGCVSVSIVVNEESKQANQLNQHNQFKQTIKVNLHFQLPVKGQYCLFYRSTQAKAKDILSLYITQLLLQTAKTENNSQLAGVIATNGYYFDTKSQQVKQLRYQALDDVKQCLENLIKGYVSGLQQPLLLNSDLAQKIHKAKQFDQQALEVFWNDPNNDFCLGKDAYMRYFWPQCPELTTFIEPMMTIYHPLFSQLQQVKK